MVFAEHSTTAFPVESPIGAMMNCYTIAALEFALRFIEIKVFESVWDWYFFVFGIGLYLIVDYFYRSVKATVSHVKEGSVFDRFG